VRYITMTGYCILRHRRTDLSHMVTMAITAILEIMATPDREEQ
jgi:hypothetical protein